MRKLILLLIIISLPLVAEEIWLGMVTGVQGDSLILCDGLKIYVPNLSLSQYVSEDKQSLDGAVTFPFTASLITNGELSKLKRTPTTSLKIHKFYDVIEGRLIERTSFK